MKAFPRPALALIVALTVIPTAALADNTPKALYEATLDFDNDGTMDRAALVQEPGSATTDLYIYLSAGSDALDLSRQPTFLKKDLTRERIRAFESKSKGSLRVEFGCGGCSNDYETTLKIAYRGGEFLVAGYTFDWDTRNGIGSCDINFLTGKGVASHGRSKSKPIKAKFAPVRLADWSEEKRPKACH